MASKIKMWFQCIVVVASLLALAMGAGGDEVPQWLLITIEFLRGLPLFLRCNLAGTTWSRPAATCWIRLKTASKLAKTGASISVVNQDVVLRGAMRTKPHDGASHRVAMRL